MACGSTCCGAPSNPRTVVEVQQARQDADSCCGVVNDASEPPVDDDQDDRSGPAGDLAARGATRVPSSTETSRTSIECRASTDSCCAPAHLPASQSSISPCAPATRSAPNPSEACTPRATTPCPDACCDDSKSPADADTCCAGDKTDLDEKTVKIRPHASDPESGLSGKEHVVLSVSGMTCTGCETKLLRTLGTLSSVAKVKTSLVLSRAEFDVDVGAQTVQEVIRHLERTTEFRCERIANRGSSLHVICNGDAAEIARGDWPGGVFEIRAIDKRRLCIDFDPRAIGARDLLSRDWSHSLELAPPVLDRALDTGARHVRHVGYMTLLSIALTIPVLVISWAPLPGKERKEITFASISLAFATLIQFIVAGPFYPKALKALVFSKVIEMDLLIVLSTSAAYVFSVVAFGYLVARRPLSTGEFFETSTLLVTLIMVGRFIAALARQKAVESISIRSLQSCSATVVHPDGTEEEIDTRLLQYGDVFKVSPYSRIPTDGTVISGASELDESMLTGESKPVEKAKGSRLIAGSLNGSGVLTVRLTRIPGDNTISTIADMVDETKLTKPKIQEIADRVATYFVPVILAITVVVFSIWIATGIAVQRKSGSEAAIQATTYAITVLIVSCPCAIGLAVPMVVVVATGVGAEWGVIFKSADAIEIAWKTAHVVFDKTGTLTRGKLSVVHKDILRPACGAEGLLLGLVGDSKHPVSIAVATHLKSEDVAAMAISNAKSIVGKGIEGAFAGQTLRAGNSRWLRLTDHTSVQPILAQGYTAFCFTINDELAAVYGLEDSLREDALDTVSKLQQRNIAVHILSGDDNGAVHRVAEQLRIPAANVRARCTPADKQAYINELLAASDARKSRRNTKQPIVMFCGDGTNDAVALAQASIGVHMSGGTDVAKSAADIVLMREGLAGILVALTVSRKSMHRIAFNFGWSLIYNVFAILLAAGAFEHARIPPEFAGLGELVSVLPVVAAGVQLKWARV